MHWHFTRGRRLAAEAEVAKKLRNASKFYRFLWEIRGELFDAAFQAELVTVYKPRGQDPCPPALLAMVNLLQRYEGPVSYTHLRAHETPEHLVCRLLLEK